MKKSYYINRNSDYSYSYEQIGRLIADGRLYAISMIREGEDGEWREVASTEFGTMVPALCSNWNMVGNILAQRWKWYSYSLIAMTISSLLAMVTIGTNAVGVMVGSVLGVAAFIAVLVYLWALLTLLYHLWGLIPEERNKIPPSLRVALLLIPFWGILWNFNVFWVLSGRLRDTHYHSGLPSLKEDCQAYALVSCIALVLWTVIGYVSGFGWLLGMVAIYCQYIAMRCMVFQGGEIIHQRLRKNYVLGGPVPGTPVPSALRRFLPQHNSRIGCFAVGLIVLILFGGSMVSALGLFGMKIYEKLVGSPQTVREYVLSEDKAQELDRAIARLDKVINEKAPGLAAKLPGPASHDQIEELRTRLNGKTIEPVERWLKFHDGSGGMELMPGGRASSAGEIIAYIRAFSLMPYMEWRHNSITLLAETEGNGYFYNLDVFPPEVCYDKFRQGYQALSYGSMAEFVNMIADGIEHGIWTYDKQGQLSCDREKYRDFLLKYRKGEVEKITLDDED